VDIALKAIADPKRREYAPGVSSEMPATDIASHFH